MSETGTIILAVGLHIVYTWFVGTSKLIDSTHRNKFMLSVAWRVVAGVDAKLATILTSY